MEGKVAAWKDWRDRFCDGEDFVIRLDWVSEERLCGCWRVRWWVKVQEELVVTVMEKRMRKVLREECEEGRWSKRRLWRRINAVLEGVGKVRERGERWAKWLDGEGGMVGPRVRQNWWDGWEREEEGMRDGEEQERNFGWSTLRLGVEEEQGEREGMTSVPLWVTATTTGEATSRLLQRRGSLGPRDMSWAWQWQHEVSRVLRRRLMQHRDGLPWEAGHRLQGLVHEVLEKLMTLPGEPPSLEANPGKTDE